MTLFFIINHGTELNAQTNDNKINLITFLSILSEEHQVFFTYDVDLVKDIYVSKHKLNNPELNTIIDYLRFQTQLYFDNLGNNYFVIYNDSKKGIASLQTARKKLNETATFNSNSYNNNRISVKGRVIDAFKNPIPEANILEEGTINGTTTDSNGEFALSITTSTNTVLVASYIGYTSKRILVKNNDEITIILESGESLNEVQIVGSRNSNRSAIDTHSAIKVIPFDKATNATGQTETNQILQFVIPSFNASKQSGADGADHVVPATLRGLGPDQTLILINGKRRHQSSLINIYGTSGRGNSGTDLNAIPAYAIERIEVLLDGASAQYGSDAIAGVINIVLKDDMESFNGSLNYGIHNANPDGYYSKANKKFDGNTLKFSSNYGIKITENGFVNITTEYLSREKTLRPGAVFREKYGDSKLNEYSLFFNSEIPLNKNSKFYAFGGYSYRNSESFAFTRSPGSPRNIIEIYPNGFNPLITGQLKDKSWSAGFKSNYNGWNIDISNTYGENDFNYVIKKTLNATLLTNSPTSFNAGGHILSQNTTNADISKFYNTVFSGVNIAFGTEYRIENYKILSGETASYAAFDIYGNIVNQNTPDEDLVKLNGLVRPRGSQGFPGYSPENEVNQIRTNLALYLDTEFDFTQKFMFGIAGRFEKYSDFGNTFNLKLSSRYKTNKNFDLRSSFSTGFRAPSLAQIYYNLTFTNFIGSDPSESLIARNDSPITQSFGINKLIEERAVNASFGFTSKIKNFKTTVDGYFINVKDRIILTGNFESNNLAPNVNLVQFFANGVTTSTFGVDIVLNWNKTFENNSFSASIAGNINNIAINKINNKNLEQETFFGKRDQYFLKASAPKNKFSFNTNYTNKKLEANIILTRFSKVILIDWQIYKPLQLEDPNSSYLNEIDRLSKAKDIYNAKVTTDINLGYKINKQIAIRLGANNLFNIYPSTQENSWTDSGGNWDSVQMGTNGSFFYSNLCYKF